MKESGVITAEYILRLYITGATPNSVKAINNTKAFCEKYLKGHYDLEVIDIYQQPLVAKSEQIIALPLLIKLSPPPLKRLIGNMSDTEKMKKGLEIYDNDMAKE
jgi:circadian clock protein KaiB